MNQKPLISSRSCCEPAFSRLTPLLGAQTLQQILHLLHVAAAQRRPRIPQQLTERHLALHHLRVPEAFLFGLHEAFPQLHGAMRLPRRRETQAQRGQAAVERLRLLDTGVLVLGQLVSSFFWLFEAAKWFRNDLFSRLDLVYNPFLRFLWVI